MAYKSTGYTPIPFKDLWTMKNKRVHVRWAYAGCSWELESYDDRRAVLVTPKTRKRITVDVDDLMYTRKHEPKCRCK